MLCLLTLHYATAAMEQAARGGTVPAMFSSLNALIPISLTSSLECVFLVLLLVTVGIRTKLHRSVTVFQEIDSEHKQVHQQALSSLAFRACSDLGNMMTPCKQSCETRCLLLPMLLRSEGHFLFKYERRRYVQAA